MAEVITPEMLAPNASPKIKEFGLLLGVLCDAHLLLDPKILKLLVLGMLALLLSGIGGIMGGYIMYFIKNLRIE